MPGAWVHSLVRELDPHMLQLKIMHAATKTQYRKIKNKLKKGGGAQTACFIPNFL